LKIRISKIKRKKGFTAREVVDREQVRQLAESMKSIGQREPILISKHGHELIDGNHRVAAAKLLGWKEIECQEVEGSDLVCHRISLVANRFSRPLSDLEIGRKAHMILETVKWNKGREKLKMQLVRDLGLHTVDKLEDCLATFRNLNPELRKLVSDSVGNHGLNVKQLREIRKLPSATQVVLAEQISKIKDDPGRVDRLIEGHLAVQEPARPQEPTANTNTTVAPVSEEEKRESEQFFPVFKFECKGRVQLVTQDELRVESRKSSMNVLNELTENLKLTHSKAKPRDFLTVSLLLESPVEKRS
jgi:hypothetical protein